MPPSFKYVILGGGVAAGYAAWEFVLSGLRPGELAIISKEQVAPYERPALSKGYLNPEGPARLPGFHTCVNMGGPAERHGPEWYAQHGITLMLQTEVIGGDLSKKELLTKSKDIIKFEKLIIATGSTAMKLTDFKVPNSDARGIYYLREEADAAILDKAVKKAKGKNAVVLGGGYIGLEIGAALVINGVQTTIVFPEPHCLRRVFTPEIAAVYQTHYDGKGVKFIQAAVVGFVVDNSLNVTGVKLKDGSSLPAAMVVVGVGARPCSYLFPKQLAIEQGGYKVNGRLETSLPDVYAVGDVATFPIKLYGNEMQLQGHVRHARMSGKYVVQSIRAQEECRVIDDYDYVPYFYSRMLDMRWQFFGKNVGDCVVWGLANVTPAGGKFGAYWVMDGKVVGAFLESGSTDEYEALSRLIREQPQVTDLKKLEEDGICFALTVASPQVVR
ncbi:hypothetical protein CBR_g42037 [Chara braunii]|uniref:monodehydroascorbate reductase (NADH) n=1 Tax=Chara braunii TaxID=69332 RepID=A0A388LWX1_CHABU|nr:hypothetical protein CBR_g42037 [Chara braunii]|eukprot:GBG86753.1 hypothetical protein CBR_g42037 [Chara braunii]